MTLAFRSVAMGAAALAGLALVKPAYADTVSTQQLSLLTQFNAIVLGNLTDSSDINGRAFVGGNLTGSLNVGRQGDVTASPYNTLTVDGSVNDGAANANNWVNINQGGFSVGGNARNINDNGGVKGTTSTAGGNVGNINLSGGALQVGGAKNGNVNNATVTYGAQVSTNPVPVSTFATLSTLSKTLSGMATSGSIAMNGNVATFTATPGTTGTAVFDVDASVAALIFSADRFQFDLGTATSAIINVEDAGSITDDTNYSGVAQDLLWNFIGTTNIAFDREFAGTVLAPDADVTNTSPIDGTLVAANATLNSEIHSAPFTGTLPDGSTPTTPVPEPASAAVVLAGVGMLAVLRRRGAPQSG